MLSITSLTLSLNRGFATLSTSKSLLASEKVSKSSAKTTLKSKINKTLETTEAEQLALEGDEEVTLN
jgi:hypothetical protein